MKQCTLLLKLSTQKHTLLTKCAMLQVRGHVQNKNRQGNFHLRHLTLYKTEFMTKPLANKV